MSEKHVPDQIMKEIELKSPVSRVWQAITDHKQFGTWFRVKLNGPFVVGEVARGHITYPGYEHFKWEATIVKMEFERVFAFTWKPYAIDQTKDYSKETPTTVEFKLEKRGDGTLLTLTEAGFNNVPEGRRFEAFRMNDRGWGTQMENIKAHVQTS